MDSGLKSRPPFTDMESKQFVTGSMNKELPGQESGGEAEPYISLPFTVHISTLKALGGPVE